MRHGLEIIDVLTPDAHIHCPDCPDLHGLDRFVARKKAAAKLEEMGLLIKVEEYENNVGFSERAHVPIEPRISMQWFLKYPCVKEAADAVANGDIQFRPERWAKTYAHWMENLQDWCISRQLWWGHQIPVWYRKEKLEALKNAESLDMSRTVRDVATSMSASSPRRRRKLGARRGRDGHLVFLMAVALRHHERPRRNSAT
jgi:valyl-tRNA synthetase